jgi:hypothetical protein
MRRMILELMPVLAMMVAGVTPAGVMKKQLLLLVQYYDATQLNIMRIQEDMILIM